MKTMITALVALFALTSAHAAEITGRSTLSLWFDEYGFVSIEIREEGGKILGRSSFGHGIVNMEKEGNTWKGHNGLGFVNLTCADGTCYGMAGSRWMKVAVDETSIRGSANQGTVDVKRSAEKIAVEAEGVLNLKRDRNGKTYSGSGYLNRNIDSRFTATLEGEGTLAEITDPGLFLSYIVAPFVRE